MELKPLVGACAALLLSIALAEGAQAETCSPILTSGERGFVRTSHVPAYLKYDCYTFTVPAGWGASVSVTGVEEVVLGISVKDVGAADYWSLLGGVTTFSSLDRMGRIVEHANTEEASKDFEISVESSKKDPDTSKEVTFRVVLQSVAETKRLAEEAKRLAEARKPWTEKVMNWFR